MPDGSAWRVAIVGAGPAAFYAAEALRKTAGSDVRIDLLERLPAPFGLVRAGVAPDHQHIKAVARQYAAIAAADGVRYLGNVSLGREVHVADLAARYDQIVYAFGCGGSRALGVPGEALAGVRPAAEFVAFYNGDAGRPVAPFALDAVERVAIVGNGNVALDVARMLLSSPARLQATDVAPTALAALAGSRVREVVLLGRRSVAEAAYAPKEMEEVAALPDVEVVIAAADARVDDASAAWLAASAPRSHQRNVAFAAAQAARSEGEGPKKLRCRFRVAPAGFVGRDGRVTGVQLQPMRLVPRRRAARRRVRGRLVQARPRRPDRHQQPRRQGRRRAHGRGPRRRPRPAAKRRRSARPAARARRRRRDVERLAAARRVGTGGRRGARRRAAQARRRRRLAGAGARAARSRRLSDDDARDRRNARSRPARRGSTVRACLRRCRCSPPANPASSPCSPANCRRSALRPRRARAASPSPATPGW